MTSPQLLIHPAEYGSSDPSSIVPMYWWSQRGAAIVRCQSFDSEHTVAKKNSVVASPQPAITPRLLTIRAAATYLSCSPWSVRELIWRRQLPKIKIGRRFCIAREDLDAWIDRQRAKSD